MRKLKYKIGDIVVGKNKWRKTEIKIIGIMNTDGLNNYTVSSRYGNATFDTNEVEENTDFLKEKNNHPLTNIFK